jgi:hypothetical protein
MPCSPTAGTWLATEQDKRTHFTLTCRIPRPDLPSVTFPGADAETVRYIPDSCPFASTRDISQIIAPAAWELREPSTITNEL